MPDSSGGLVAVFCPLKLFLHTGQVSCWRKKVVKTYMHKLLDKMLNMFGKKCIR